MVFKAGGNVIANRIFKVKKKTMWILIFKFVLKLPFVHVQNCIKVESNELQD